MTWNVNTPNCRNEERRIFIGNAALLAILAGPVAVYAKAKETRPSGMSNPENNKQVVRDLIDVVWREGRLDELPRFWTANCINHADPAHEKTGLTALRNYHAQFARFFASFSDVRIEVLQQVAERDRAVTQMSARMKHTGIFMGVAPTGKTAQLDTIRIDRFVDGRIAEHWSIGDMTGLMQQLQSA